MQNRLISFARENGLILPTQAPDKLLAYAQRVLAKKSQLNLTGAASLEEIVNRHLCDGLIGAAQILSLAEKAGLEKFSVIDAGSGAGFIGLTLAAALPQADVLLVESLEKRCAFLNWVILQEGFKNVRVKNIRLGQTPLNPADFVIERAMGQIPDIAGLCLDIVKPGGVWLAYQGENPQIDVDISGYQAKWEQVKSYQLLQDRKAKHLVLCRKAV